MIPLLIAQIVINSYSFGTATVSPGGAGFITQEDGTYLMQQDSSSKFLKEFTFGGNIDQEDGFGLMQQDGTSTIQQQ